MATPTVLKRLAAIESPEAFAEAARAIAADLGVTLSADALRPAEPTPVDRWPGAGWLPTRSVATGDILSFDWAWFGEAPPHEPFHADAVRRTVTRPFNRAFAMRTTLDALIRGDAARAPDGLIFHMSRCGSTLAARMLAAVPGHVVVSEPEPLDAVVQWAARGIAPHATCAAALRAIVAALGREKGRYFLKLDAWHTRALPLFRAAFPDTPWLFLHRDPVEVMVSHMRMRGSHTVAGVLPPHVLDIPDASTLSAEDHAAQALARICAAVCDHWRLGGGMLVDYTELEVAMRDRIPAHFGFVPDARAARLMAVAGRENAKHPRRRFVADAEGKRASVTRAITDAVALHLRPAVARLETLRKAAEMTPRCGGLD